MEPCWAPSPPTRRWPPTAHTSTRSAMPTPTPERSRLTMPTGKLVWSFTGDGTLSTAPFVVHGVVYIGGTSGNLYGLDGVSGRQLWSANVGSSMWVAPGYGTGAPWQGFGAGQGYLFAAAGNQLVAYRGTAAGPPPSPSPSASPSPSPSPAPRPTPSMPPGIPGSSPNSLRGGNPVPPTVPPCLCATGAAPANPKNAPRADGLQPSPASAGPSLGSATSPATVQPAALSAMQQ